MSTATDACNHLGCPFPNKIFLGETNTHEVSASMDGLYLITDDDKYFFQLLLSPDIAVHNH
jgi:hypothetical protein